ncbi:hypothetical protein PanWU01x14_250620 [Parasponia andersonii]|uniref:Uncharacterized protein n=1 Tax=Parasponia andersonii TaxID=3476 RepID=A0A2P5BCL8_PARAD|nr:hypothetical protein PanWU01x14_250620 [Parasponia andersonii]
MQPTLLPKARIQGLVDGEWRMEIDCMVFNCEAYLERIFKCGAYFRDACHGVQELARFAKFTKVSGEFRLRFASDELLERLVESKSSQI